MQGGWWPDGRGPLSAQSVLRFQLDISPTTRELFHYSRHDPATSFGRHLWLLFAYRWLMGLKAFSDAIPIQFVSWFSGDDCPSRHGTADHFQTPPMLIHVADWRLLCLVGASVRNFFSFHVGILFLPRWGRYFESCSYTQSDQLVDLILPPLKIFVT